MKHQPTQAEENKQVWDYFRNRNNGFYCEVGANDPVALSQTYFLEQQGWNGILVEPLPNCVDALKNKRKATVIEGACGCSEDPENITIYLGGTVSTAVPNINNSEAFYNAGSINVKRYTLTEIFDLHSGSQEIDFLSIDVEGFELSVLKGLDFKKYRPKLILLEDQIHTRDAHNLLRKNSYKLVCRTGLNSWYIPQEDPYKLALIQRIEFFRKLYIGTIFRRIKHKWKMFKRSFL